MMRSSEVSEDEVGHEESSSVYQIWRIVCELTWELSDGIQFIHLIYNVKLPTRTSQQTLTLSTVRSHIAGRAGTCTISRVTRSSILASTWHRAVYAGSTNGTCCDGARVQTNKQTNKHIRQTWIHARMHNAHRKVFWILKVNPPSRKNTKTRNWICPRCE